MRESSFIGVHKKITYVSVYILMYSMFLISVFQRVNESLIFELNFEIKWQLVKVRLYRRHLAMERIMMLERKYDLFDP